MSTEHKLGFETRPDRQWTSMTIDNYMIVSETGGSELRVTVYRVEPDETWTRLSTERYPVEKQT